jgi:hypothetical protein
LIADARTKFLNLDFGHGLKVKIFNGFCPMEFSIRF